MKRDSSFLMIGVAVLLGAVVAFGVAVKFVKKAHAQNANPPAAAPAPAPAPGPAPTEAGVVPPPSSDLPPPPVDEQGDAGGGLDASQDPGLKTTNPEGYVYDPAGRRDPFFPPQTLVPIQVPNATPNQGPVSNNNNGPRDPFLAFNLKDYRLVAIMWDVQDPRAIVQTPENQMLTLHLKMRLGKENAVVAAIRENEILAVEPGETGDFKKGEVHRIKMKN